MTSQTTEEFIKVIQSGQLDNIDDFLINGSIDWQKLKKLDPILFKYNVYREFYAQFYNIVNGIKNDHIVDGKYIVTNEPIILNVHLRDSRYDISLDSALLVYNYYNNSIFDYNGSMYSAEDKFPYKNSSLYEAMKAVFDKPVFLNYNKPGQLYLSVVMSYLKNVGYDIENFKNCKNLCDSNNILGLLNKYDATHDQKYLKQIAQISKLDSNEAFVYLVDNSIYQDLAATNFFKQLGYEIPSISEMNTICDKIPSISMLFKFKAYLKSVCTKNGTFEIPVSLCIPQFYAFVNSISYCNGYQLEIINGSLHTTKTTSQFLIDTLSEIRYKNAFIKFLNTFSPMMNFEKFIFTIKTSDFIEDDIPKCLKEIETFDTIVCSLVNSAVLTFKFGMIVQTKPEYLFTLLPTINSTDFFTECCGDVKFASKPCDIICKYNIPLPKIKLYKEALQYAASLPKTEEEYYSLILQLTVNREVLLQCFDASRSDESYLTAHLLIGHKLNSSIASVLTKYIAPFKFVAKQNTNPPKLVKSILNVWLNHFQMYEIPDITPIENSKMNYTTLVNYIMNNFID